MKIRKKNEELNLENAEDTKLGHSEEISKDASEQNGSSIIEEVLEKTVGNEESEVTSGVTPTSSCSDAQNLDTTDSKLSKNNKVCMHIYLHYRSVVCSPWYSLVNGTCLIIYFFKVASGETACVFWIALANAS